MQRDSEPVQIITSMMTRVGEYRKVIAFSCVFTGIICALFGSILTVKAGRELAPGEMGMPTGQWIGLWMAGFAGCFISALILASGRAKKKSQSTFSPGLRHALRTMAPALIAGSATGIMIARANANFLPMAAALWVIFYGVALLSVKLVSPMSLRLLGMLMLALGLAFFALSLSVLGGLQVNAFHLANFSLSLAFGMFHIVFGFGSLLFERD